MKTKIHIFLFFMLFSGLSFGQPGWQDFTARYFYTILDENGKEISFKNNPDYSIMIDSILFKSPNIPNESLKPASSSDEGYENQIRINDFSFALPQKKFFQQNDKQLEIKIIHKRDTMYICQPSGRGSFGSFTKIDFQSKEPIKPEADFTLTFKAGHYYFQNWTQDILNHLPETSGNVKFLNTANLNDQYFIVPKNIYISSLLYNYDPYEHNKADDYVANNFFLKGHFSVEKRIEPTKNNQLAIEYSWIGKPVSTKDANRFWGMINFSGSYFSQRTTFFTLNKEENTIKLFLPKKDPRLFTCEAPYIDTFNSILYLPVSIKQEFNEDMSVVEYNKMPPENYIYRSQDEGLTWEKDKKVKEIFDRYHFFEKHGRKIEFIDKDYALVYFKEVIERNEKKNRIKEQGTYYLLKNMQVIDSLKSPDDAPFYMYYNEISVKDGNFVMLGEWSYDYDKTYFQLSLNRVNDRWKFQTEKKFYAQNSEPQQRQKHLENDTIKEYKNFHLINKQELVFKNGSGKMRLKYDYYDTSNSIFEKDNQIYIIGSRSVYMSFDGGTNWYLYPVSILPNTYYYLLDINDQLEIYHFSNKRIDSKNCETRKTFYKFSLE